MTHNYNYIKIHRWVKKNKIKPVCCEECGDKGELEISNINHKYSHNLDDYYYLCRSCHIKRDKNNTNRFSEDWKNKISNAHIGMKPSIESKNKMSLSKVGKKLSLDHIKRISVGLMGHRISEETKNKIRLSNKKTWELKLKDLKDIKELGGF